MSFAHMHDSIAAADLFLSRLWFLNIAIDCLDPRPYYNLMTTKRVFSDKTRVHVLFEAITLDLLSKNDFYKQT